ncbi:MAG: gluconate 2-dehydrogenase subunit 3 family protein, partial [Gemmatimonadetes bacterium]|nr:gluconate 2-dehydrogenase subunit 3 family protein [Gemmatimonadota bacterium]
METEGTTDGDPTEGIRTGDVTRRRALQVLAAGAAGAASLPALGCEDPDASAEDGPRAAPPADGNPLAAGTPTDPDLVAPVVPWELTLTEDERSTLASLCDVILPADERSPSASAVGAHEFIDEWVSAPYDGNRDDLVLVRGGLVWLDTESIDRFGARFSAATPEQRVEICDDICY